MPFKVLLVEDEWYEAEAICQALKAKDPETEVDVKYRGDDAYNYFVLGTDISCDAVVLDLGLPGKISGTDLLYAWHEAGYDIPIIVMTGAGETYRAKAMALGAADYIIKPDFKGLIESIYKHIEFSRDNRSMVRTA